MKEKFISAKEPNENPKKVRATKGSVYLDNRGRNFGGRNRWTRGQASRGRKSF
jgi:hypothetical protein